VFILIKVTKIISVTEFLLPCLLLFLAGPFIIIGILARAISMYLLGIAEKYFDVRVNEVKPSKNGWCVITGASKGLGKAMALEFARKGWNLVLIARSNELLEETAKLCKMANSTISVKPEECDISDAAAVGKLVEKLKSLQVDILVNNAGVGHASNFHTMPASKPQEMIDLNISALVRLTQAVLPPMIERRKGRLLFVSSLGRYSCGKYSAIYMASKAFVSSFGQALVEELRNTGVGVLVLEPGPVPDTDFKTQAGCSDDAVAFKLPYLMKSEEIAALTLEKLLSDACHGCLLPSKMDKLSATSSFFLTDFIMGSITKICMK
jgi:uncharacterized protein